uniref:Uncharacterized protein n=1 Tax=Phenylobacterium glaciei TaxID=2803784 RepID=A0A974P4M6_9CAUL|nr:hypothetical protein JKL49_07005 [Phenylobacterium glaciei]
MIGFKGLGSRSWKHPIRSSLTASSRHSQTRRSESFQVSQTSMKHPLESDAERAFELLKQTTEHGVRQGVQLGTWLVVGNGGGLVLTMQAIIQTNSSAATHLLQPAAYSFALGVVLAFSAAIITYVAWIAAVSWMTLRYDGLAGIAAADFIEREGVIIEEGSKLIN